MDKIQGIQITFGPHPHDPEFSLAMNETYSGLIPSFERVFIDSFTKQTLKPDHELIPLLRKIVVDEMIIPNATNTPHDIVVPPLFAHAAMFVLFDNNIQGRLSSHHLKTRMSDPNVTFVQVKINISHIHHDYSDGALDVLNWDTFVTEKYQKSFFPVAKFVSF